MEYAVWSRPSFSGWRLMLAMELEEEEPPVPVPPPRKKKEKPPRKPAWNPVEELSDIEFKARYRLTKEGFVHLCEDLRTLTELRRTKRVTLEAKVLCALHFYACGAYQKLLGMAMANQMKQKSCSNYIEEVTQALIHPQMMGKYIVFPNSPTARQEVAQKFFIKYGIPGVLGCIDCRHFKIFKPDNKVEHLYFCRKQYHALNVQMVCDSEHRIINVNPKFGGDTEDSFIWENSFLSPHMQALHQSGENVCLLGDSGYPQLPWLMTPISDAAGGSPEALYNQKHFITRQTIHNTAGRLKNRWRCLSKEKGLHYKPEKCAKIILACCVLYNFAIDQNIHYEDDSVSDVDHWADDLAAYRDDLAQVDSGDPVQRDEEETRNLMRGMEFRDCLVSALNVQYYNYNL